MALSFNFWGAHAGYTAGEKAQQKSEGDLENKHLVKQNGSWGTITPFSR